MQVPAGAEEADTFAYLVSHALKGPLRGIAGYNKLLLNGYADRLDDEGRQFLRNIREGVLQMNLLIDDLASYARLKASTRAIGEVIVQPLIAELIAEQSVEIRTRGVTISVHLPFTELMADREWLAVVLRNLLANALKFTENQSKPKIELGGHAEAGLCTLWIRDNGIGFDMIYHDRIFNIFERLHLAEDYPGSGVGLAIVDKLIRLMGGRVWAESEPGKGATFYLTLAARQD